MKTQKRASKRIASAAKGGTGPGPGGEKLGVRKTLLSGHYVVFTRLALPDTRRFARELHGRYLTTFKATAN